MPDNKLEELLQIRISDHASEKFKESLKSQDPTYAIRVFVSGGYHLALDKQRPHDFKIEINGVPFLLDPYSVKYAGHLFIDYIEKENESGFLLTNPTVKPPITCGCDSDCSCKK